MLEHATFLLKSFNETTIMILDDVTNQAAHTVTTSGISLGAAIAVVCSWQRNRSIIWAIVAGVLSWFYVIYFALTRRPEETN